MIKNFRKSKFKRFLNKYNPVYVLERLRIFLLQYRNKKRNVKDVFIDVYKRNRWGKNKEDFFSGLGSYGFEAKEYTNLINSFIKNFDKQKIRVVDLGCGDFNIGRQIVKKNIEYIGVDIVPELIIRNKKKFSSKKVDFICLDIISDNLPKGDICLLRLVLQHLSNNQIKKILQKIAIYNFVFITEHYPLNDTNVIPNRDKIHGPYIRLIKDSAIYLDKDPFNLSNIKLMLKTSLSFMRGEFRTYLLTNKKN